MPDFCPRLSSEFARIHNELKKNPDDYNKTHLLTISFDPKYDTPAVLRKYGLNYLEGDKSGFAHWDFASTNPDDLRRSGGGIRPGIWRGRSRDYPFHGDRADRA